MSDDLDLLRDYLERGSEDAFRSLVERHCGMVHGTALRIVRDDALAQEVSQAVFIILARKAASLRRETILAGWLYRTARFVALEALRSEQRRREYHHGFAQMNDTDDSSSIWDQIAPVLEELMNRLRAADRDALVLRFLEEKSFAEVASALGTSEAAAKMRVGRALDKLRVRFARHGIVISATALLTAFSSHAACSAPAGLAGKFAATALAGHALNTSVFVKGALKVMTRNKIKALALTAAIALLLVGGAVTIHKHFTRRASASTIVRSFEPMAGEWEGTFESSGDALPKPVQDPVALSIRTSKSGRVCEIEMRMLDPTGAAARTYRFTHTLNESGDRIITVDDPRVGRLNNDGLITESIDYRKTGEWRAAFRAALPNGSGYTECRWVRKGDQLSIAREDVTAGPRGATHLFSNLELRRHPAVTANR